MKVFSIILMLFPIYFNSQTYEALNIKEILETADEPDRITFKKNSIFLDGKKCFNYSLERNVYVDGEKAPNYFKITDNKGNRLFAGVIRKDERGKFESEIEFYLINEKGYKNPKIIGRNDLILNLSANQVINKDCSINIDNLKVFYQLTNKNKK
ncbi:MAG: hypothetical protein Q4A00_00525 [Flavobacteriaceae bacterium]|nr:hypothetical protein [Flavobacteriaceae bacterium]